MIDATRAQILAAASAALAASLDPEATAATLVSVTVPAACDISVLDLLEEDGSLRRLVHSPARPEQVEVALAVGRGSPEGGDRYGSRGVMESLEPTLIPFVTDDVLLSHAVDEEDLRLLRGLDVCSFVCVPLRRSSRAIGAMTLLRTGAAPPYTAEDVALFMEVARHGALALENARRHDRAVRALATRGELLSAFAHDLRNPLNAIVVSASLLEDTAGTGEAAERTRKRAAAIQRSADRMTRLISDLVALVQLEGGQLEIERGMHDAVPLVTDVIELVSSRAGERAATIERDLQTDSCPVYCDPDRVQQALVALLENAVKVTEAGIVRVTLSELEDEIEIAVSDGGAGLAAEDRARVFDGFGRTRDGTRRGGAIGLAVARGIVEAHGGTIWVESSPGTGSTFHFTLPREPRGAPAQSPLRTGSAGHPQPG